MYNHVQGPYEGVILPSLWLLEGGQTAAGAALDHFISSHPASQGQVDYKMLDERLEQLAVSMMRWLVVDTCYNYE